MAAPVRALFVLAVVGFLASGVYDILSNFEENKCEMTWMFQQPEYLPIKLAKKLRNAFPRYGLYIYGEGGYAKDLRATKFALTGIPVLFIPGNAGSHKQVRSLGSVAQRKAEGIRNFFHFNFFSVDLNEELSGVYGQQLYQQTKFVHHSIQKILSLYKTTESPPTSVIVVGHSMGGMVARALFTLPGFDPSTVRTIITQATPHQGPVIMLDHYIAEFYRTVNEYWTDQMESTLRDVVVISTGGGFRDFQVRHDLTSLNGLVSPDRRTSTSTMSVPKAWVSTDHLCAVWCRQMVLATTRALFDTINRTTLQESTDVENRMTVYKYHFLDNPGSKEFLPEWEEIPEIVKPAEWEEISSKQWLVTRNKRKNFVYLTVAINDHRDKTLVAISNAKLDNWILACNIKTGQKECKDVTSLAERGRVIPPLYSNKRVAHVELSELDKFSHVVFVLPRGEDKTVVSGEILAKKQKDLKYRIPSLKDMLVSFPSSLLSKKLIFTIKGDNSIFRNISLVGLTNIFKTYHVFLESDGCKGSTDEYDGSVMKFHQPGSTEDTFSFIKQGESGQLPVKRQSVLEKNDECPPQLHLYLQPGCSYRVSIKAGIQDFTGQFVRFYFPLLTAFVICNILMAFMGQLRALNSKQNCPSFLESLGKISKPYYIVPIAEGVRFLLNREEVTALFSPLSIPPDDRHHLDKQGTWFLGFPLVLYLVSLGCVTFHVYILDKTLKISAKILFRICCCPNVCLWLFKLLKYTLILSAIGLSFYVCGSMGIVICYSVQLVKLIALRCNCERNPTDQTSSKFNFHFSLFLLQLWLVIINAAPLLVWARQLEYSSRLDVDPSRLPGLLFSVAYLLITLRDDPSPIKGVYTAVCFLLYIQAVFLILFSIYSQYRISYVIVTTTLSLVLPQLLAGRPPSGENLAKLKPE